MMSVPLSILQLNIERAKHLDVIIPFIKKGRPDVFCLQEIRKNDVSLFEKELGVKAYFVPMGVERSEDSSSLMGIAIFSRLPILSSLSEYYYGDGRNFSKFVPYSKKGFQRVFIYCDVEKEGSRFRIGTTHFTWSLDGKADERQRRDLKSLLNILEKVGEIVFTGDFNAPRGREIFGELSKRFKDNIPRQYTSSLDNELHRRKDLDLMVDGIFSTPGYKVSDVEMMCGLSDHCALMAKVSKV